VRARLGRTLVLTSHHPDFDADAATRDLRALGVVRTAAPNQTLKYDLVPNDQYFVSHQWQLSASAAGIRAQNAWDITTGDSSVVIAIMDSGVDRTHPDLAAKIWTNTGEIPDNVTDDDGNGYVDDVNGWDFSTADNDPNPVLAIHPSIGYDTGFHGTFVAGLAAAATNNTTGIAGVSWKSKIMPLKVSDADAEISLAAVTEAFQYATDNGVDVLNVSFGGTDPLLQGFFQPLVIDAVDGNVLFVCSAGNDGNDLPHYPAACESVLAVGASTQANSRASYSCWGWFVDLFATGDNVWSSIPTNYTYDMTSEFIFSFVYGWDGVNPYMSNVGSSFAAPVAAGAAALVRGQFPTANAVAVLKHMPQTADPVNYDFGPGKRLNAYQALLTNIDVPPLVVATGASFALAPMAPNPMRAGGTVELSLARAGAVRVGVFDTRGRLVRTVFDGALEAGPQRLSWDGTQDGGVRVAPGLYFVRAEFEGAARATRVTVLAP
jgi:subtilisin family serine protease